MGQTKQCLSAVGVVFSYVLLICPPSVCSSDCEPHQNTKHLLQVSLCAIFSLCTFVHCAQNHVTLLVFAFVARLLLSKRAVLLFKLLNLNLLPLPQVQQTSDYNHTACWCSINSKITFMKSLVHQSLALQRETNGNYPMLATRLEFCKPMELKCPYIVQKRGKHVQSLMMPWLNKHVHQNQK
jgi:hypothetical protein